MDRSPTFNLLSPLSPNTPGARPEPRRRLSTFSALSNAEQETNVNALQEEIAEIKRYEVIILEAAIHGKLCRQLICGRTSPP